MARGRSLICVLSVSIVTRLCRRFRQRRMYVNVPLQRINAVKLLQFINAVNAVTPLHLINAVKLLLLHQRPQLERAKLAPINVSQQWQEGKASGGDEPRLPTPLLQNDGPRAAALLHVVVHVDYSQHALGGLQAWDEVLAQLLCSKSASETGRTTWRAAPASDGGTNLARKYTRGYQRASSERRCSRQQATMPGRGGGNLTTATSVRKIRP